MDYGQMEQQGNYLNGNSNLTGWNYFENLGAVNGVNQPGNTGLGQPINYGQVDGLSVNGHVAEHVYGQNFNGQFFNGNILSHQMDARHLSGPSFNGRQPGPPLNGLPPRSEHVAAVNGQNESRPSVHADIRSNMHHQPPEAPEPVQNTDLNFAEAARGTAPLPYLKPSSYFNADPSPYHNLALGQLGGDVTKGGFVKAHAIAAGDFGLIPSLNITPAKTIVDGKPVLELTDDDVAKAEDLFRNAVVIKF